MPKQIFSIRPIQTKKIIRSSRRTLALQVDQNGELIIRAPWKLSEKYIQNFIQKQKHWIEKQKTHKKENPVPVKQIRVGEKFWLFGREYPLALENLHRSPYLIFTENVFRFDPRHTLQAEKIFRNFYKKELKKVLNPRVEFYVQKMQLKPRNIKITGAEKRWGSCNLRGNLNFSWRLALVPPEVLDYVVVHEMAHLAELNHSKHFWKKVIETLPEYQTQRTWLRKNELKLKFDLKKTQI